MSGKTKRCVGIVALVAWTLGGGIAANPAWAAPPANDTLDGAVVIDQAPFTHSQSTVEAAETDPFETSLNRRCGAQTVEHGVWFTATAATSGTVVVDATGSDYSASIMVFEGTPTPDGLILCAQGQFSGPATPGTTYNLLVFGDGLSEATSGNLTLEVRAPTPPPDVAVTVDPHAKLNRHGAVRLSGTVTCTSSDGSGEALDVSGSLTQRSGQSRIQGSFSSFTGAPCDGSTVRWEAFVRVENGTFSDGKATAVATSLGCSEGGCTEGRSASVVQVRTDQR